MIFQEDFDCVSLVRTHLYQENLNDRRASLYTEVQLYLSTGTAWDIFNCMHNDNFLSLMNKKKMRPE